MSEAKTQSGGAMTAMHVHIIGVSVCLAAVAAVWLFGVGPTISTHAAAKAQQDAIATKDKQADELQNHIVQVERRLSQKLHE